MKKLVFTWFLMLVALSAINAQTEKGRWTVGTSVGNFSYSTQYGYRSFSGNVAPSAGYFLGNGFVAGAGLPLSLGISSSKNNLVHSRSSSIGLSPFVRYYVGKDRLKPYVEMAYTYSTTSQKTENPNQISDYKGFSSRLSPTIGLAYFINPTVALNGGISYIYSWYDNGLPNYDINGNPIESTAYRSSYVTLNVGFQLFFGK